LCRITDIYTVNSCFQVFKDISFSLISMHCVVILVFTFFSSHFSGILLAN
jgi:hypothetical protein